MYDYFDSGFITRTFSDIFPSASIFKTEYLESEMPNLLKEETSINTIYYLLYAKYGNSHIASTDENQFMYNVWGNIFKYGAVWEKRLEVQQKLINLTDDQLETGTKQIFNHAYNPSTSPSTDTLEELPTINDQNSNKIKKSKIQAYTDLYTALKTDVTTWFVDTFKKLFMTVPVGGKPLVYKSEGENDNGNI